MDQGRLISLRQYQSEIVEQVCSSTTDDIIQCDTGAGKTRCIAEIARRSPYCLVVAHRNLLVKQLSRELARFSIRHNLIGTAHTRRVCLAEHRKVATDSFSDTQNLYVCSIDSIWARVRRDALAVDTQKPWLILIDEGHHARPHNKWGWLKKLFPRCRIVGFTATPLTISGKPMGKKSGGIYDSMIQAPSLGGANSVSTLIEHGHLCRYEAWGFTDHLDGIKIPERNGDYVYHELDEHTRTHRFTMGGDAVTQYRKHAHNVPAVVFCVSIDIAIDTAKIFREAGYSAAVTSSRFSSSENRRVFDLFEQGVITVLCHVDMLGEGVDVPNIGCVIMLRKTASLSAYRQWCGRLMRPAPGKKIGVILDHVGNVQRHGLPDAPRKWELDYKNIDKYTNTIACTACGFLFSAFNVACPKCGEFREVQESPRGSASWTTEQLYTDWDLIKLGQSKAMQAWEHENKLSIREERRPPDGIRALLFDVKLWAAEAVVASNPIPEVNSWLASTNDKYWISNFKLSDIGKSSNKAIREFEKWNSK